MDKPAAADHASDAVQPADWNPAEHADMPARMAQMKEMRERCPVAYTHRGTAGWGLLRYEDIKAAVLDTENYVNGMAPRHGQALPPLEVDQPEHREYRRVLTPFFTGKRMAALEPQVRQLTTGLLEPLMQSGSVDLAREFSYPLPVLGLCTVLGFGAERWAEIKAASEDTLLVESDIREERERAQVSHQQLLALARELLRNRRKEPRDPEADLPTAILGASILGKPIDDELAAGMLRLLISAGHSTTTSGLGNSLLHLAQNPESQQRLRADPTLLPTAIEELLRFDTPVQAMPRRAARDITLHGRTMHAGEKVDMFFGSANRDEAVFPEAERCILDRQPNRHLAFGHGIHLCLGASLARMEIRVALEELLSRTKSFVPAGDVVRTQFHRVGVKSLPVHIEWR